MKDSKERLLPTKINVPSLTPAKCIKACGGQGFSNAGVQMGKECWCGHVAPPEDKKVSMEDCNMDCEGDSDIKCGGPWRMRVFKVGSQGNLYLNIFNGCPTRNILAETLKPKFILLETFNLKVFYHQYKEQIKSIFLLKR